MNIELSVALIASGASLVVALISLLTSLMTNRLSSRSAQQIEVLRNDFSRQQSVEEPSPAFR
jgi:biopolymer transport protein ExbB/TolQ